MPLSDPLGLDRETMRRLGYRVCVRRRSNGAEDERLSRRAP